MSWSESIESGGERSNEPIIVWRVSELASAGCDTTDYKSTVQCMPEAGGIINSSINSNTLLVVEVIDLLAIVLSFEVYYCAPMIIVYCYITSIRPDIISSSTRTCTVILVGQTR